MDKPSTPEEKEKEKEKPKSGGRVSLILSIVTLVISLGAVAGVFYICHKQRLQESQSSATTQQIQTHLSNTQTQLGDQQQAMESMQVSLQHLTKITGTSNRTWKLAEAKYLLQLANYSLTFSHNVPVTIKLLQSTDKRVASLGDPSLISLRRSLAENIAALKAVPKVDTTGLILRIDALSDQVANIPMAPQTIDKPTEQSVSEDSVSKNKLHEIWQEFVTNSWDSLKKVVVVRHLEKPVVPMLPPAQHAYLVANVRWQLSQAQWAVLHNNPVIYQKSLQLTENWVAQYFTVESTAKTSMLKSLGELAKQNIQPALPNISSSLSLLNKAIQISAQNKTTTKPKLHKQPAADMPEVMQS